MILKLDNGTMLATVTLDKGEELDIPGLDVLLQMVTLDPVGFWNVDLVLESRALNYCIDAVMQRGFAPAGNLSIDNTIFMKVRKSLRRSGDGGGRLADPNLAVAAYHPGASAQELEAMAESGKRIETTFSDEAGAGR